MRTETEMLDLILQTAKNLKVEVVAMSGSRTMMLFMSWTT